MNIFQQLSATEKNLIMFSLPIINLNMEFFSLRFYYHFLQSKAGFLFKNTKIEQQHKMFGVSLSLILTYLTDPNPELLETYLETLVKSHVEFGVVSNHVNDFIEAFMKALSEILPENTDMQLLYTWRKVISDIMSVFRENI